MTGPVRHPEWCDKSRCSDTAARPGTHCSAVAVLGPYPPSTVVAEVSIAQGPAVPGYPLSGRPFVALALGEVNDELCLTPIPIELAGRLGQVLTGFVRRVEP